MNLEKCIEYCPNAGKSVEANVAKEIERETT